MDFLSIGKDVDTVLVFQCMALSGAENFSVLNYAYSSELDF
jgi:hypothetical protein